MHGDKWKEMRGGMSKQQEGKEGAMEARKLGAKELGVSGGRKIE